MCFLSCLKDVKADYNIKSRWTALKKQHGYCIMWVSLFHEFTFMSKWLSNMDTQRWVVSDNIYKYVILVTAMHTTTWLFKPSQVTVLIIVETPNQAWCTRGSIGTRLWTKWTSIGEPSMSSRKFLPIVQELRLWQVSWCWFCRLIDIIDKNNTIGAWYVHDDPFQVLILCNINDKLITVNCLMQIQAI